MCGSTRTTSTTATCARSSSRRSWTSWSTGISPRRTSRKTPSHNREKARNRGPFPFWRACRSDLLAERLPRQPATRLDAFPGKPALVHLEHVAHRPRGTVRVGGLRLHVREVDDFAVVGNESSGERQHGVLHPEALHPGFLEGEQHALLLRHLLAEHQAGRSLLR